jgi:hypothetical protein
MALRMRAFVIHGWAVLAGLLLALALCGCTGAKTKYLIPGVDLPRDSAVVSEAESDQLEGRLEHAPIPGGVFKAITVNFDNPHGWAVVASHYDILLNDRGFLNVNDNLEQVFADETLSADQRQKIRQYWPDYRGARIYVKEKGEYAILLWDLEHVLQTETEEAAARHTKAPQSGRYVMAAMKLGGAVHIRTPEEIAAAREAAKNKNNPGGAGGQPPPPPPPPG